MTELSRARFFELKRLIHLDAWLYRRHAMECEGKFRFNSSADARRNGIRNQHVKMGVYKCAFYHHWHVGTAK